MPTISSISFHYIDISFSFVNRTFTKKLISDLIKRENKRLDHINYIFCTDHYLLQLNRDYLGHDTLTDIITFHYQEADLPIHSDIYISIDRVKENATIFKTSFRIELHRVIFHGALHLCGYGDKSKKEQVVMRRKEQEFLALL